MCTKPSEPLQICHFQTSSSTRYSLSCCLFFVLSFARSLCVCASPYTFKQATVCVYCFAVNLNFCETHATVSIVTENKCCAHVCEHNITHTIEKTNKPSTSSSVLSLHLSRFVRRLAVNEIKAFHCVQRAHAESNYSECSACVCVCVRMRMGKRKR